MSSKDQIEYIGIGIFIGIMIGFLIGLVFVEIFP